jgi:LAO/AO transport system kinase
VLVLDAFGKDVVLVETVGVGQDEVEIARAADTTLVVGVPGLGDDIQAIKAGILEIADILVVNKADLTGADRLAADLRAMQQLAPSSSTWIAPIARTVALDGTGIPELVDRIAEHREFLQQSGTALARRTESARRQVRAIVEERVLRRFEGVTHHEGWQASFAAIAAREEDPYTVAEQLLREVAHGA